MTYTITLPDFSGPLDLLLRLIERAELDVTTIALAQVADQFLTHVRSLEAPEPRALADFVSLAARLLLIKSRALLPRPASEGRPAPVDPDADALARQLQEYRRYKQVATLLRAWQDDERRTFLPGGPVPAVLDRTPVPVRHTLAELLAALQRRMQLALPSGEATVFDLQPRRTVAEAVGLIHERLAHQNWCSFDDLFEAVVSREDVIVTFWAILELLKRRAILVEQDELFGTISLGRAN